MEESDYNYWREKFEEPFLLKIKEFELILQQEVNNDDNYLGVKQKLHTLLEVFQEHFNLKE